jgi:hypothetical protein
LLRASPAPPPSSFTALNLITKKHPDAMARAAAIMQKSRNFGALPSMYLK